MTRTPRFLAALLAVAVLLAGPARLPGQSVDAPGTARSDPPASGASRDSAASPDVSGASEGLVFRRTIAPAVLITLGLATFADEGLLSRGEIHEWRDENFPTFSNHLDNLGQFAPAVLALGLEAIGVEGRHELGRATVTFAGAAGITVLGVNALKSVTDVARPHDSATDAFPSGHTAAAFASARFLDRELGHRSSLYSLAGYGVATFTGLFRQLNDRHWLSDVLVGAGLGMLSTDIAYAIADEVFGDRGVNPVASPRGPGSRGPASYLDVRIGAAAAAGDLDDTSGVFDASSGWIAGLEGAWFFSRSLGIGGEVDVAGFPVSGSGRIPSDPVLDERIESVSTQPFGSESILVGPFFRLGLSERFDITGKVAAGLAAGATTTVRAIVREPYRETLGDELELLRFSADESLGVAAGAGIRVRVSGRMAVRGFVEWHASSPDYEIRVLEGPVDGGNPGLGEPVTIPSVAFQYVGFGLSASAMLW